VLRVCWRAIDPGIDDFLEEVAIGEASTEIPSLDWRRLWEVNDFGLASEESFRLLPPF
jgi:hypothetical protein